MECTVRWTGSDAGMSFVAEMGSGHAVVMDGAPEAGGRNIGPPPMEMVLAGTGGGSAFDVVLILKKGRHAVTACEVRLQAERAAAPPPRSLRKSTCTIASGARISSPRPSYARSSYRRKSTARPRSCWARPPT